MRAISKFTGTPPAGTGAGGFDFFAQLLTAGITGTLRTESCADLDSVMRSLSPLPSDNIATLVGSSLGAALANVPRRAEGNEGPPLRIRPA